jgi:O-Antigen ligase
MNDIFLDQPDRVQNTFISAERSLITLLPKLIVIIAGLMIVVDGALPQVEIAITGGSLLFIPRSHYFLVLGLVSMLLLKGRFQASPLLPLALVLLSYATIEVCFLHFYRDLSISSIRRSFEYFFLLLIVGGASVVPLQIKARHFLTAFVVITFACLIISAAQFLTNLPIVATESADHAFQVESWGFFGRTRAFSLFGSALQAGIFYCFMGGVATSFCLRRGRRNFGLFLLPLCAFGCYVTYTRLVMVGFILTVIAVFAMSRKGFARFSPLLPILSLGCAVLLVAQGIRSVGGAGRNDLANSSSMDERILNWGVYSKKFLAGSPVDILFGTGFGPYAPYTMPDRPENAAPVPVDNAYLLILLSTGVCGLVLLSVAYWRFWTFLHDRAASSKDHLFNGITAMFATVPLFCAISDPPTQIIVLLLFAVSMDLGNDVSLASGHSIMAEQSLKPA